MDWHYLAGFALVSTLNAASPGPNLALMTNNVSKSGKSVGFATLAGLIAAYYLHGTMAVFGLSVVLENNRSLFFVVKMVGAAYLCFLGIQALREAKLRPIKIIQTVPHACGRQSPLNGLCQGFITNVFNPYTFLFFIAAFPLLLSTTQGIETSALFLLNTHVVVNIAWYTLVVLLVNRLVFSAGNGSITRWVSACTGVIMIAIGLSFASSSM